MTKGYQTYSARTVLCQQSQREGVARFNPTPHVPSPSFRLLLLGEGSQTAPHNHTEAEVWTVLHGKIDVEVEGETVALDKGSVINLAPLQRHHIRSKEGESILQTCFWHDQEDFE
jgi:mannose-6-phosphate isomerase-like protein (cupin superfamily)